MITNLVVFMFGAVLYNGPHLSLTVMTNNQQVSGATKEVTGNIER